MIVRCLLLILLAFASGENGNFFEIEKNSEDRNGAGTIVVKIEEDEYVKKKSNYIGVGYNEKPATWRAYRRSKDEKKNVYNGNYKDEETTAHASDTLARNLMANGEKGHKLNFPDDDTEVYPEKRSNYIGVNYNKRYERWAVQRWSKNKNKRFYNGSYKNEETAAHASDAVARKLIANGEKGHKLNFPDDNTEVWAGKNSDYFGVNYNKKQERWRAGRWSKNENKKVHNGTTYKDKETAARASDTVARKLMANGETGHKLNFPDDDTEVYPEESKHQKKKRKRSNNLEHFQEKKSDQNSI